MTNLQVVTEPQADSRAGLTDSTVQRTGLIRFAEQWVPDTYLTAPQASTSPSHSREADWLADVEDEMRGYADLAPNWDSYGGGPVSTRIVDEATMVAELMALFGFSRPDVCPESSGGILLEWQQSDRVLTVDLDGKEEFSFAYETRGEPESEGDFEDFVSLLNGGLQPF